MERPCQRINLVRQSRRQPDRRVLTAPTAIKTPTHQTPAPRIFRRSGGGASPRISTAPRINQF